MARERRPLAGPRGVLPPLFGFPWEQPQLKSIAQETEEEGKRRDRERALPLLREWTAEMNRVQERISDLWNVMNRLRSFTPDLYVQVREEYAPASAQLSRAIHEAEEGVRRLRAERPR